MSVLIDIETTYPYTLENFVQSLKDDPAFSNLNDEQQELLRIVGI